LFVVEATNNCFFVKGLVIPVTKREGGVISWLFSILGCTVKYILFSLFAVAVAMLFFRDEVNYYTDMFLESDLYAMFESETVTPARNDIFIYPEVEPEIISDIDNREWLTIALVLKEELRYLDEVRWSEMQTNQKLDLLQHIANLESTYLGLPSPVIVSIGYRNEPVLASYNKSRNAIIINEDKFDSLDSKRAVGTILHEMAHAYQHASVAALDLVGDFSNLKLFWDAHEYKEGFANYLYDADYSDSAQLEEYLNNAVEVAARKYSETLVRYFSLIMYVT